MWVVPTHRVTFRLAADGPEIILRVPETNLRVIADTLIFNNAEFSVAVEPDPFADDILDQSASVSVPGSPP